MKGSNYPVRLDKWRPAPPSSETHMEALSLRVGSRLFVIGGYQTLTTMCERIQILDIESGEWTFGPDLPPGFPLSHAGVTTDGNFLFVVSGQPGPACEPATNRSWALDLEKMAWTSMAPLPVARFAPILEYLDGNLHLISGATEDRETISCDHFVLETNGQNGPTSSRTLPSIEQHLWRRGPPIPKGGDHQGSVVLDGKLYVIGGEHGHGPVTMDASKCCGAYWVHNYLFRYDPRTELWERLADMPFGSSHIEAQVAVIDDRIVVFGGAGDRDELIDKVQEYDPQRDCWRQLECLPAPRKGGVMWHHDGSMYFCGGQILGGEVVAETMTARIRRRGLLGLLGF